MDDDVEVDCCAAGDENNPPDAGAEFPNIEVPGEDDDAAAVPKIDCPDETKADEVVDVALELDPNMDCEEEPPKADCPKELLLPKTEVDEDVDAEGPPKMDGCTAVLSEFCPKILAPAVPPPPPPAP